MKVRLPGIFGIIFFSLISTFISAQGNPAVNDTLLQSRTAKVSSNTSDRQNPSADNQKKDQKIKKVKSSRPDMSKAKTAKPTVIRPAGPKVPKGAGRPGGAIKPGVMKKPGKR